MPLSKVQQAGKADMVEKSTAKGRSTVAQGVEAVITAALLVSPSAQTV